MRGNCGPKGHGPAYGHGPGRGYGRGHPYPGRWERLHHGTPPWWPKGEPWPPAGNFPLEMRRRFLLRIGLFLVLASLIVLALPLALIWSFLTAASVAGEVKVVVVVGTFVFLVALIGLLTGGARRYALPLGRLIEAAGRVETGDFSVRVAEPRHGGRELRALTRAFNDMATRLEADERQRRDLLADVSHELRTPLAVLQGELEAMIDGIHPTDEAHLGAALEGTRVLARLVDDLRTLTLAETGTLALHREPTDLAILIRDVADSFAAIAGSGDVRIAVETPPDLPLLNVDPLRVRQVLSNLVSNALRYAPAGSEVGVDARLLGSGERLDGRLEVWIADHGPGIDPAIRDRLFERFAKAADSRGSGLGLAIARRLVEAHGGRIEVRQPAEGGTVICFELPLQPDRPD